MAMTMTLSMMIMITMIMITAPYDHYWFNYVAYDYFGKIWISMWISETPFDTNLL